jgi:GNAT superfamily N-acetyltransferase
LANGVLDISLVPPALPGGRAPSKPPPILTLAWLGVDAAFAGQGLGTKLFARALADCVQVFGLVRFVAVIVDALTTANEAFYASHGFLPVPGAPGKLYLPAATLLAVAGPPPTGPA